MDATIMCVSCFEKMPEDYFFRGLHQCEGIQIDKWREQLAVLEEERNRQYWIFTRQEKGQPVDPKLTRQIYELEERITAALALKTQNVVPVATSPPEEQT